jgi:hypothetical protein
MSSSSSNITNGLAETIQSSPTISSDSTYGFSNKTIIIILSLIIVMILLNTETRVILETLAKTVYNLSMNILRLLGIVTGSAINLTANVGGNVARTGIDITQGALHSVGNILTGGNTNLGNINLGNANLGNANLANANQAKDLDNTINKATIAQSNTIPNPDNAGNPIQKPIVDNKQSWCLVGEYKGTRGCIEVSNADKCMSGQVYPQQKMCLNPALTKHT